MTKNKKKIGFSLKKLIYNDKALIICSVIAAVIIWVVTSMNLSPETTKKITVPVSVDFTGTVAEQLGIEYYGNSSLTTEVTVSCKKYLAKDIDENDISASLQTNTIIAAGYYSVPIVVSAAEDADFTIVSYFPTTAQGYYDVAQEISLPVELNFINEDFAADGYVVGETTLNQSSVLVRGAAAYVSTVEKISADINIERGQKESQVITLEPAAYDKNGAKVDNVSLVIPDGETSLIATVPVLKVQDLSPAVTFTAGPNNPESFLDIKYSVRSVQVGALESAQLSELNLGTVSFGDLKPGENVFKFKTADVNGVTVLDGTDEITVTVTVPDSYTTKVIPIGINDINADTENFDVTVNGISGRGVTVAGESDAVANLGKTDLKLSLAPENGDEEISEKTKKCRIVISINGNGRYWVLGSYTASVTVKSK